MTTYWLFSSWTGSFSLFTLLCSCYLWNSVPLDLSPPTGLHQVTLDLYYACVRVDTIVWSILFLDYTSVKVSSPNGDSRIIFLLTVIVSYFWRHKAIPLRGLQEILGKHVSLPAAACTRMPSPRCHVQNICASLQAGLRQLTCPSLGASILGFCSCEDRKRVLDWWFIA